MDTKKNIFTKNKFWAIILVAQFSLFYILSKITAVVNFFSALFEWKKHSHILLFSTFEFSVGDIFYTIVSLFLMYAIVKLFRDRKRKNLLPLLIFINIFYFTYQCCWGMLYFQKPLAKKLTEKKITDADLKKLAIKYLMLCRETREKVDEDANGIFIVNDSKEIEREILYQQNKLPLQISGKTPSELLSVKKSLYSGVMNYTGILGYYNPFTAESQYNVYLPGTQFPFTLAHEMSHQLGFAREQEASFIAYLCARNSTNLNLKYSVQLYVLKSVLRNLSVKNESFVKGVLLQYSDKMKRDRENELIFFEKHKSFLSAVFGFTNDLFLKSNQQEGSITYSYFITLVALYEA